MVVSENVNRYTSERMPERLAALYPSSLFRSLI
jgi:hypothetical protein